MAEALAPERKCRKLIEETVISILKASDIETATELSIRTITAQRLGVNCFNLDQKRFIRTLIESFLLSPESRNNYDANGVQELEFVARGANCDVGIGVQELETSGSDCNGVKELGMVEGGTNNGDFNGVESSGVVLGLEVPQEHQQEGGGGGGGSFQNGDSRIICELSQLRNVSVHDFKGQSVVTIQDYYQKDGMQFPKSRGMSLTAEQWLSIKNSIPSIEEAITTMQSRLRLPAAGKPSDPYVSCPVADSAQANVTEYSKQMDSFYSAQESICEGSKQMEVESILPPSSLMHVPIRLDGANYYLWKHQMEFLLAESKVAYVLTEACPSISTTLSGTREEMDQAIASTKKWLDDDYICRHKILTCLCDNLYNDYSRKACNAKELWEELKSVYDEDIGTRRSQINNYVKFQIVDGISILEQVHELQSIAHSICASGTWIDEYFHVSFIISKLPPSWKEFRLRMMQKEVVPLHTLMHCLKVEEDACNAKLLKPSRHGVGSKCESRVGSQGREIKRICYNCKKDGHISKNCPDRKPEVCHNGNTKENGHCPKGDRGYHG